MLLGGRPRAHRQDAADCDRGPRADCRPARGLQARPEGDADVADASEGKPKGPHMFIFGMQLSLTHAQMAGFH